LVYVDPNYEGKMNANDKLTDEEIWSVIEYMYSVWPEDVQSKYNELFLSE
jgi:mono/diheme cytochrome c family protein